MWCIYAALIFFLVAGSRSSSANQEVFDKSPEVNLRWSWDLQFTYCAKDSASCTANLSYAPLSSKFEVIKNVAGESDNLTMLLIVKPKIVTGGQFTELELSIVVERLEEYFAWTNMTLTFAFSRTSTSEFPIDKQEVQSLSTKKFFTRTDEVYECQSKIPVSLGENVTISFWDMSFQAFDAEPLPASNRLREVCPRDFKTNVPITALTGASLLIIVVIAALICALSIYLERRKTKNN